MDHRAPIRAGSSSLQASISVVRTTQVVSSIEAAHSKGSSVKLVSMDEVSRWLPAVKQQHAEDTATLAEWYTSHVNWIPPDPDTLVGSMCAWRAAANVVPVWMLPRA
jgi:hypothetical protein